MQHFAHDTEQVLLYFRIGHIQHQLIPSPHRRTLRNLNCPVRMCPIEVAVLGDHLRLEPDAEPHAHRLDLLHQIVQSAGELFLIDKPVPQSGAVVVPLAEPAVVQHQHIHAEACSFFGNVQDLFRIEAEIGGFPVVDQHRTFCQLILAAADVFPNCPMKLVGQSFQSGAAIGQQHFRCGKTLPCSQLPAEQVRVDSHDYTHLPQLVTLDLGLVAAAVDQSRPHAGTGGFRAVRCTEQHGGILVMTGRAAGAGTLLNAMKQRTAFCLPFHGVSAVEVYPLPAALSHVQTKACRLGQCHRCFAQIADLCTACHNVQFRQHAVFQSPFHRRSRIPQNHFQCFRFVLSGIQRRQTGNGILALFHRVAVVPQIQCTAAVSVYRFHCRHPKIAYACSGIFQRQGVQRIGAVISGIMGISGKAYVRIVLQIGHVTASLCTVPEMPQDPVGVRLHLVHGMLCFQCKNSLFCIDLDCHIQHSFRIQKTV